MKIGFFTDSYFPEIDGVTYTMKSWRDRLEERGHEVYIIYPETDEYEPGEGEIPVPSVSNPFYDGYRVSPPIGFDRFPELDVVHVHSPFGIGRAGKLYADRNDVPSVYTHHTPVEEYVIQVVRSKLISDAIASAYVPLENHFLRGFDVVTSSTPEVARDVETVELPVGIDMEFFRPGDVENESPVIGYSGRLSVEKNLDQVLEMAEMFDGKTVIVGEGPQEERLKSQAPENVEFRGFLPRDELPGFYSGLDVFVTASTGDTLGLSTLEANACGTPVVAPDVPPFDRTINDENGVRFREGDPTDMLSAVHEAMERDFDTREAVRKYSLASTVESLEEIYRSLHR